MSKNLPVPSTNPSVGLRYLCCLEPKTEVVSYRNTGTRTAGKVDGPGVKGPDVLPLVVG